MAGQGRAHGLACGVRCTTGQPAGQHVPQGGEHVDVVGRLIGLAGEEGGQAGPRTVLVGTRVTGRLDTDRRGPGRRRGVQATEPVTGEQLCLQRAGVAELRRHRGRRATVGEHDGDRGLPRCGKLPHPRADGPVGRGDRRRGHRQHAVDELGGPLHRGGEGRQTHRVLPAVGDELQLTGAFAEHRQRPGQWFEGDGPGHRVDSAETQGAHRGTVVVTDDQHRLLDRQAGADPEPGGGVHGVRGDHHGLGTPHRVLADEWQLVAQPWRFDDQRQGVAGVGLGDDLDLLLLRPQIDGAGDDQRLVAAAEGHGHRRQAGESGQARRLGSLDVESLDDGVLVAEGLVARAAHADQVLAHPGGVVGLRVEDIEQAALGGHLQRLLLGDLFTGLVGACPGAHRQEPDLRGAGDGRREHGLQALGVHRQSTEGPHTGGRLVGFMEDDALTRIDTTHLPHRRTRHSGAVDVQGDGVRQVDVADHPAVPRLDGTLGDHRQRLVTDGVDGGGVRWADDEDAVMVQGHPVGEVLATTGEDEHRVSLVDTVDHPGVVVGEVADADLADRATHRDIEDAGDGTARDVGATGTETGRAALDVDVPTDLAVTVLVERDLGQTQHGALTGQVEGQTRLILTGTDTDTVTSGGGARGALGEFLDDVFEDQRGDAVGGADGAGLQAVPPVAGVLGDVADDAHDRGDEVGGQRGQHRTHRAGLQ